MIKTLTH